MGAMSVMSAWGCGIRAGSTSRAPRQAPHNPPVVGSSPQDDRTRFDTDELLQNAVLHWIEIIGEAARGVSDKVRDAHPEVPWRVITDMRIG